MNRTPGIRLFLVLAALTALLAAPAAEARGLGSQRPAAGVEAGWMSAALQWLEQALGLRRPAPRTGSSTTKEDTSGGSLSGGTGGATTMGGTCIDPNGVTRPWCSGG
ncbi:MAG TPA: hypothetical protein VF789_15305 [Thermoanaerobaculia bacterium]